MTCRGCRETAICPESETPGLSLTEICSDTLPSLPLGGGGGGSGHGEVSE